MWIILLLLWLSVEDWREGRLSMPVIFVLGVTGLVHAVSNSVAVFPWLGAALLLFGRCTGERIGYGDGWLMLALGMWLLPGRLWEMFLGGLFVGMIWALFRKCQEIPLVPFMTAVYVAGELI